MSAFLHATAFEAAAPLFSIVRETGRHVAAREILLDAAMGPGRKRKASEALRRGRRPAVDLAFAAIAADGRLVGTVRLWGIAAGQRDGDDVPALLLGPLAVDPSLHKAGIGGALMRHATCKAARLGHGAVLLMGDPEYYGRFGFSSAATANLAMPGPFEPHRLLALEIAPGHLAGAAGTLAPTSRRQPSVITGDTGRHDRFTRPVNTAKYRR
ncbi:GNAT family N-acetyltransferase [Aurantimonas sp. A3-2-R12]|uniref:GNAT family N-acetyltransferase n=1 Tax=Aurantimonas sp. A3-2-R12 TaxID=3114362 RepID=UPI002E19F9E3|nr:N-acetyltransferase [Aurantimonas sp. A3-2-R12]